MKFDKKESFKAIGYWSSFGAMILGLINCIVYLVKGIKTPDTTQRSGFNSVVNCIVQKGGESVLYKISLGILALSVLAMMISFFVNAKTILKILMAVARITQLVSVAALFIFREPPFANLFLIPLGVMEIMAVVLYLIERNHRKTFIKIGIFFIITTGFPVIFVVVAGLLIIGLILFIISIIAALFQAPDEAMIAITDLSGKVIGWIKRE